LSSLIKKKIKKYLKNFTRRKILLKKWNFLLLSLDKTTVCHGEKSLAGSGTKTFENSQPSRQQVKIF